MTGSGPRHASRRARLSRVWFPTALEETGSDIPPGIPSRVRYAFRVSHPLDVLIPPESFRPCFVPVTLMGLSPSKSSPLPARFGLSASPTRLTLARTVPFTLDERDLARLPGLTLEASVAALKEPSRRIRGPRFPVWPASSLGFFPSRGVSSSRRPRSSRNLPPGAFIPGSANLPWVGTLGVLIARRFEILRRELRPS